LTTPSPAISPLSLHDALPILQLAPRAVAGRIAASLPGARLSANADQAAPVLRVMRSLIWTAWGMVVLMAGATAAAVVLAARGALDTHRPTIEVMHGIGATDE